MTFRTFVRDNILFIAFTLLLTVSLVKLVAGGYWEFNNALLQAGGTTVAFPSYLTCGHFLKYTFDNWEVEFFQIALFTVLALFLPRKRRMAIRNSGRAGRKSP